MSESNYPGDHQLAGLVEAATAAADQEVEWSQHDAAADSTHQAFESEAGHEGSAGNAYITSRSSNYNPSVRNARDDRELEVQDQSYNRKRKRGSDSIEVDHFAEEQATGQSMPSQPSLDRPSGNVQPAAALFRAPSTTSKKYTRPPMSKLFASLQLLPEDFLHLQSAAKAYMLDEKHPERRDCVGQRGRTDSDMVKLKLWKCVQDFLEEGNGERFFGVHARKTDTMDGSPPMTWPEDAQEIIKTCIPLLRRMVTNERQRQYAVETRKGGGDSRRDGPEQNARKQVQQPSRAGIDEKENADTFVTETIDMFEDGLIPSGAEAGRWYGVYNLNSNGELDRIYARSGLPRSLFSQVVTNIDGHCRLYHRVSNPQCTDACRTKLVGGLVELPVVQQLRSVRDPWETVREVFDVVLTHLNRIQYWHSAGTRDMADIDGSSARGASNESCSSSRQYTDSSTTHDRNGASMQPQSNPLQLLIYILHQNKSILPSFEIPSSRCPNIDSLRTQIEDHYGVKMLQEKGVTSLPALPIKVWLLDGLVRIEDDGQWMVALLSADTVEWMGGQLRVLLEA